jgi:Protein kinase domain/Leucine rich repeat
MPSTPQSILTQLQNGELQGQTRLKLAAALTEFPQEIFSLAESLEILDLSNNRLSHLPEDFARLQRLKILFISQNQFEVLPAVLGQCPNLEMVGFKANRIQTVPGSALPPQLRWLILTDNQISQLPPELGTCHRLQKLMLAGNQLRSLPSEMADCQNLELIRLAANRLEALPPWLLQLPRLAWLAWGGNPGCLGPTMGDDQALQQIPWPELEGTDTPEHLPCLGEGASGMIYQTRYQGREVAVKLFKGAVTSDGLPEDEMRLCLAAGSHAHLVGVVGRLVAHPQGLQGLVLPLLDPVFRGLGLPPSFESCTRDVFAPDCRFTLAFTTRVARGIAAAVCHLHQRGVMHGDLYAHNILVNPTGTPILTDFGAASGCADTALAGRLEKLEVRAFGYLLEDLLDRVDFNPVSELAQWTALNQLKQSCLSPLAGDRPSFSDLVLAI